MRIRPRAPPLDFWNVRASTTCSRVTLPILVKTRPMGRPWSWSMGGMPVAGAGAVPGPPAEAGGLAEGVVGPPGRTGTLFAGMPPAVGGPDAPTLGAFGVVTFGLFAATPGADACGVVGRCGLGCPDGAPGAGGVIRDIEDLSINPKFQISDFKSQSLNRFSFPSSPACARGWR